MECPGSTCYIGGMSHTELIIARHAEAKHAATPHIIAGQAPYSQLTPIGRKQGAQLGWKWHDQGVRPDRADSSTSIRALQTMNTALMTRPGGIMPINTSKVLQEQCLGSHEGQPRDLVYTEELKQRIAEQGADYKHPGYNQAGEAGMSLTAVARGLAGYLIALRAVAEPPESVVAISHHTALRTLFAFVELDGFHEPIDPLELQAAMMEQPAIEPCAQALIIVEGDPQNFGCRVEYTRQPLGQL